MVVLARLAVVAVIIVLSFTTMDVVNKQAFAAESRNQPHINFSSASYTLEKTKTDVKGDSEGWFELAEWRNIEGDSFVLVKILAQVSYNKLFMDSHVVSPDKAVHQFTGDKSISLGSHGKVDLEKGFYEYQTYIQYGVQCVYIQSYWRDRSFGGVDMVRGAKASDSIVGNHILKAIFCDEHKTEMGSKDVTEFMSSIDLRDAHWSSNWFEGVVSTSSTDSFKQTGPGSDVGTDQQPERVTTQSTSTSPVSAIEFYGQAEEEINTHTYDKNLWAKALVDVEGDEVKRKARYIELRANQLYSENVSTMPSTNLETQPESDNGLTGTYLSNITRNISNHVLARKNSRNIKIRLVQEGNTISGDAFTRDSEITGTIEGDTIKFKFWWGGLGINGEWKVIGDGSRLEGSWSHPHNSGKWNLTRVE